MYHFIFKVCKKRSFGFTCQRYQFYYFSRVRKSFSFVKKADRVQDIIIREYMKRYKGNNVFLLADTGNVPKHILILGR